MTDINIEVANKVSATMRADKIAFAVAFRTVMQNYPNLDFATTKISVGSILGKRKRRPRKKKVSAKQIEMFFGESRDTHLRQAAEHETSLTAGIPAHDL